jgi:hypothetical protein
MTTLLLLVLCVVGFCIGKVIVAFLEAAFPEYF